MKKYVFSQIFANPQLSPAQSAFFLQARAGVNEKATPKQYLCTKIAIFGQKLISTTLINHARFCSNRF